MFDDFVKQLRAYTCDCFSGNPKHLTWEAADRIEELQRQLAASDEEIRALRDEIDNMEYEMRELGERS